MTPTLLHGSIRKQLALLIIIATIPGIFLVVLQSMRAADHLVRDSSADMEGFAQDLGGIQARATRAMRDLLENLAVMPEVRAADRRACTHLFTRILKTTPEYGALHLVDLDGNMIASSNARKQVNFAHTKHFRDAVALQTFVTGEYLVGVTLKKPVFTFGNPVFDESGRLIAVLLASIQLDLYTNFFQYAHFGPDTFYAICDHRGIILLRHPRLNNDTGRPITALDFNTLDLNRNEGVYTVTGTDGVERILAHQALRLSDRHTPYMHIFVGVPRSNLTRQIINASIADFALLLLTLTSGLLGGWLLIGRRLSRDFRDMTEAAARIGHGAYTTRMETESSVSEMHSLAGSFNAMTDALVQTIDQLRHTESTLRSNEQRFRLLFEDAPIAYQALDADGIILAVNTHFSKVTGYAPDEVIGTPFADLLHPDSLDNFREHFATCTTTGDGPASEFRLRCKSGTFILGRFTGRASVAEGGRFLQTHYVFRDITRERDTQNALRERENLLTTILQTSLDGFWINDDQGLVLDVNDAQCRRLGYSRDEFLAMHIRDFEEGATRALIPERLERIRVHGSERFEATHICKDGTPVDVEISATRMDLSGGLYVCFSRDISGYKNTLKRIDQEASINLAQASLAKMLVSADSSMDALAAEVHYWARLLTDSEFALVATIDPVTGNHLGHTLSTTPGKSGCMLDNRSPVFPRDPDGYGGLWGHALNTRQAFFTNTPFEHPMSHGIPDGHVPLKRYMAAPAAYGNTLLGQIAVANAGRDYTDRDVAIITALADLYALAIRRVRDREQLLEASARAEAASRTKSEFLANMSHEIRTPLNGILGMLQLIENGLENEEELQYCRLAIQATQRLNRLLSDILDLSRVEAGKLPVRNEPFRLRESIQHVVDLYTPTEVQTGVALRHHIDDRLPDHLVGDCIRLQQVLTNLMGNAFKFTHDGFVELEVYPLPADGPGQVRILFTISDSGCGIPASALPLLFQPFTQASQGFARSHQGAGLGLSICYHLTTLMGGTIAVESDEGQGTTFQFCITAGRLQHELMPDHGVSESGTSRRLRIVLAEDDEVTMLAARKLLEKAGHQVSLARNGREVLDLLHAGAYDLVLMDVQMPVMNGLEATRAIREQGDASWRGIPIIALTAYGMREDRTRLLRSGMDAYVAKPVSMEELATAMAAVLQATQ